ncbi:MAG TPA: hypothetical protein VK893_02865 [Pyrinomonadaceae bacterium]|nr:hypothetical protein [Pyrinomonadaceae bacterium]
MSSAQRETLVKQAQIFRERAEELVWRRAQPRTTVIEDASVANITEPTNRQTVRTPTAETHVQRASATSTQATPQQLPQLDPGLLDRLTEDVIRRVEKRALIERQRRGL